MELNSTTDATHEEDITTKEQPIEYDEKTKMLIDLLNQSKFYSSFLTKSINITTMERKAGITDALLKNERQKVNKQLPKEDSDVEVIEDEEEDEQGGNAEYKYKYPQFFKGQLRDYQIEGVEWLKSLYENGINGILADEMGLGKTVQVIAFLCFLIDMTCTGPFLIVAPLSVVSTWVGEFQKFAPQLKTLLFHGNAERRQELMQSFTKYSSRKGRQMYPILITTYETPFTERLFFQSHVWKYIVADEGHRLKNHNSRLSRTLRSLQSENSLILTGTPLQNNLEELWALLNFIMPHMFTDLPLFESWLNMEEFSESSKIVRQETENKVVSTMHEILGPFILRRLKADVRITLPPKKQVLVYVPMSQLQMDMYTATLNESINDYLGLKLQMADIDVSQSNKRRCTQTEKRYNYDMLKLEELMELAENENGKGHKDADINVLHDAEGHECRVYVTMMSPHVQLLKIVQHPYLLQMPVKRGTREILITPGLIQKSGKFLVLDALLPKLKARGHKILLFSTLVMVLDLLEEYLIMRKYRYVRLDGSTQLEERCENMNLFNNDPDVFIFLMTTRTGGLGLNLIGADTVILFNSDWNPQIDIQAQDRCHRLGQTKPVIVYRLITLGTIEEKVYEFSVRKRNLEKVILHNRTFRNRQKDAFHNITVQELKDLLDSKDHHKVVLSSDSAVFTKQEIKELLDRSVMPSST